MMAPVRAGVLPERLRWLEVCVLMRTFCGALGIRVPSLRGLDADEALCLYRELTAACMEVALEDDEVAAIMRGWLGDAALVQGERVRALVPARLVGSLELARILYRGIGIEVAGELPGELRLCPCSFSQRYTPQDCWFMSAFDEGFLRGVSGCRDATLVFSCRLTQGDSCCVAQFRDM